MLFYVKVQDIYPKFIILSWRKILTAVIRSYSKSPKFLFFRETNIHAYLFAHISRLCLENRGARKLRPALPGRKRCCFPFFVFHLRHFHTLSRTHKHAEANRPTSLSPLVTHSCSHIPPGGCCGPLNGRKWGEPLLAAHAINSKASRFYWMDLARPPRSSSHQPPPLYWLLRRGWIGAKARAGCRSIDRASCITVHS